MKKAAPLSILVVVVLLAVAVRAEAQQPKKVFPGEAKPKLDSWSLSAFQSVKSTKSSEMIVFCPLMHFSWSECAPISRVFKMACVLPKDLYGSRQS
jgi:hypothetical protein